MASSYSQLPTTMPFATASGRGVRVAVIDSGVNTRHPHIIAKTTGVGVEEGMEESWNDKLGHGTAVTAAIQEKAPDAEYRAVRVFGNSLSTSSRRLLQAMEWAIADRVHLINLSLGTHNLAYRLEFEAIAKKAAAAGVVIVCARREGETPVLPGVLDDVISVDVDWRLSRHQFRVVTDSPFCYAASGFPRPLPGLSPSQNLNGISFAVANMTGLIARACESLASWSLVSVERALANEVLRVSE